MEKDEDENEPLLPPMIDLKKVPENPSELGVYGQELYKVVENRSSPLRDAVITFYVGAMARVYSGEQAEIDLITIQNAQRERAAHGKASRRSIQNGRVVKKIITIFHRMQFI
jgi:hypothetical protein